MSKGKSKNVEGYEQKDERERPKTRGLSYKVCEVDNHALELFLNNLDGSTGIVTMFALNQLRTMVVYREASTRPLSLKEFATATGKIGENLQRGGDRKRLSPNKNE